MKYKTMEYIIENQQYQIKQLKEQLDIEKTINTELLKELTNQKDESEPNYNPIFEPIFNAFRRRY